MTQSSVTGDNTIPTPATQSGYDIANMVIGESAGDIQEPSVYALQRGLHDPARYALTGPCQSTVGVGTAGKPGDQKISSVYPIYL